MNPVNMASGARKGRERGGGRSAGCFFPSRVSSRAGKAETLENTEYLILWSYRVSSVICSFLTLQKNIWGAGQRPAG